MPTTFRVLGQAYPTAATETTLYTCGVVSTVVSSLTVCNNSASPDTVTVRICVAGAGDTNAQLLYSNLPLVASATLAMTVGITLASTDAVKVTSTNGVSAFQIFGQENS